MLSMQARLIVVACLWTVASACSGMKGASTSQDSRAASAEKRELRADIVNSTGSSMGTMKFSSGNDGHGGAGVTVEADIKGLVPAGTFHGMHIHANNNPANGKCIAPTFAQPEGISAPTAKSMASIWETCRCFLHSPMARQGTTL